MIAAAVMGGASLVAAFAVSLAVGWVLLSALAVVAERIGGWPSASRARELERLRMEKEAEIELAVLRDRLTRRREERDARGAGHE